MVKIVVVFLLLCSLLTVSLVSAADEQSGVVTDNAQGQLGSFPQWSKVEIDMTGPASTGMGTPNPFLIEVDVTFTGPGGTFIVPGYYDGDGAGGMDGNVWKARFAPNATGAWSYTSSSSEGTLNGESNTFTVTAPTGCTAYVPGGLPDFLCEGMLMGGGGEHYLQFASGLFWLKGGEDEPESFLATPVNSTCGASPGCGFATKELAFDYLASQGVNSVYLMSQNIDGDANNVWPYVGTSSSTAKTNHERIDVARMLQWEEWFDHAQSVGIVIHFVLEDDSGWDLFNRPFYYREMIARFGHYNGIYFNIAEEYGENYSASQAAAHGATFKAIDPYDHPLTVHNVGDAHVAWDPFLGNTTFDLTSFQDNISPWNAQAAVWFQDVEDSGHTIPVMFDETSALSVSERDLTRNILWQVYMGGANFEMLTQPVSDFSDFELHFEDMTRARGKIESLPYNLMRPSNGLLSGGTGYAFAQTGQAYMVYLPSGGNINLNLTGNSNTFDAEWFNPRNGSIDPLSPVVGGGVEAFSAPDSNDWVLVLEISGGVGNTAPVASNQNATTDEDVAVNLTLSFTDPDGPGPNVVTIIDNVDFGVLSGSGVSRTYTPNTGYSGPDSFTWSINDGIDESNVATFSLTVTAAGNVAPVADADSVTVDEDSSSNYIQLTYTDPDGPGPFVITIENDVDFGTLTGSDNDRFYTPNAGYSGSDQFTWSVNDGIDGSNIAAVDITVTPLANVPPTAQGDSVVTPEDTLLPITLTATDPEECEMSTFVIVAAPTNGTLGSLAAQTCAAGSPNTDTVIVNYTPDLGYSGADSFTWRANDGTDNSNTATITIMVTSADVTFQMQFQDGEAGGWTLPFEIILFTPVGGPYTASTTITPTAISNGDENGTASDVVAPGTYDIWAKGATTLATFVSSVNLTGSPPPPVNLGLLQSGDYDNDNVINKFDYIPLLLNFGQVTSSLPAPDQVNDHNQDGNVDITDFRIIINNYKDTGIAEPACC